MKISIGPIQYFWKRDRVFTFYEELLDSVADIFYLGETVCSKRRELTLKDWLEIAGKLKTAGKEVVLSGLCLIEAESELAGLQQIVNNNSYTVEANDMAAIQLLSGKSPFVIGPHINIYNHKSLQQLAGAGAARWVVPVELGKSVIAEIQQQRSDAMQTEIFAFGRLPLAFSARCFSARAHNRAKDQCGFVCGEYEDGMALYTQQEQPFLLLNGIQIQSAATHNLINHYAELLSLDIDIVRVAPQTGGMNEIVNITRQVIDGVIDGKQASEQLRRHQAYGNCNGYWNGVAGIQDVLAAIPADN